MHMNYFIIYYLAFILPGRNQSAIVSSLHQETYRNYEICKSNAISTIFLYVFLLFLLFLMFLSVFIFFKQTVNGEGPDNHLLALKEIAKSQDNVEIPLFQDKSYWEYLNFRLSTSQVNLLLSNPCLLVTQNILFKN